MLAGVNLHGLHDLATASRSASWEAQIALEVSATPAPAGECRVSVLPMRLGPTRVVRPFTIRLRTPGAERGQHLTPVEGILAALSAGGAATAATALALQGIQPQRITVRAGTRPDGTLGCAFDFSADMSVEQVAIAISQVHRYGVAHRTVAEASPLRLLAASADAHVRIATTGHPAGTARPDRAQQTRADWETGMFSLATAGESVVPVDQPKQLFGGDQAPAPEEYLLAALAGEALQWLSPGDDPDDRYEVHVSARRDLRGELGLDQSRVALRDVLIQCLVPALDTTGRLEAWAAEGHALHLIQHPQHLVTTASLDGTPVPLPEPETAHAP